MSDLGGEGGEVNLFSTLCVNCFLQGSADVGSWFGSVRSSLSNALSIIPAEYAIPGVLLITGMMVRPNYYCTVLSDGFNFEIKLCCLNCQFIPTWSVSFQCMLIYVAAVVSAM